MVTVAHSIMEYSKVLKSATPDVGLVVVKSVLFREFFPVLGKGTPFSSLFRSRFHVVKAREKTSRLSCDDRDRKPSSKMMKNQASF